jgi:hypothetical protein
MGRSGFGMQGVIRLRDRVGRTIPIVVVRSGLTCPRDCGLGILDRPAVSCTRIHDRMEDRCLLGFCF